MYNLNPSVRVAEINIPLGELYHLCDNKPKGVCCVRYCKNKSRQHGRLCGSHHTGAWRKRNPMRYAWNNLRTHAKSRKLDFDIPFESFAEMCEQTGYMEGKGCKPENLAIDRIRNWEGYVMGNIRVVTVAVNASKGYYEGKLKLSSGQEVMLEVINIESYDARKDELNAKYNKWHPSNRKAEAESEAQGEFHEMPKWMQQGRKKVTNDDPF